MSTSRRGAVLWILVLLLAAAGFVQAQVLEIDEWLVAGPVVYPYAEPDTGLNVDPVKQLLENLPVDPFEYWPSAGDPVMLGVGQQTMFRAADASLMADEDAAGTRFALLAAYLDVPAWQEGTLKLVTGSPFALYVDGEKATSRVEFKDEADTTSHEVVLDGGHHRLLLALALADTQQVDGWSVDASYEMGADFEADWLPGLTLDPVHPVDIEDYFRMESVDLEISPDGRWLAADISKRSRKDDSTSDRLEVWDTKEKEPVWSYTAAKGVSNVAWSPDNSRLLFISDGTLFLWHREANRVERIEREFEKASQFKWSADGNGLFYLKTIEPEEDDKDYQVVWKLADRWAGWRNHTAVQYFSLADGLDSRIATMKYGPDTWDVGHDGNTLAFKRTLPLRDRPYEMMDIQVFDLQSGEMKTAYQSRKQTWSTAIALSPDGKQLAFTAPKGEVSGDDSPPPYFNTGHQFLWILNIESGDVAMVDPEFKPSVHYILYRTGRDNEFEWTDDNVVAFEAIYMKKVLFCTWRPGEEQIETRHLSTPGYSKLTIATGEGANMIAYRGDIVEDMPTVHVYNTKSNKGEELIAINEDARELTEGTPRVEDYDFVNSDGVAVYGYLYYPYNYDESKSYPLVVDTYGGVIGFGDSWQWFTEVMASHDYFVYIPIPRGAVGYGQEYADTHSGDWGELTSRDMNEGVRHIVANVSGVDGDRVGFASGSYGGFLAMYLLSIPKDHPDYYPYATAISNYGISNLASYWGVGWWGVHYSEKASTGLYPWNAAQWYIDHSPLFQADNITAPLLLLHGEADINVPVGESAQMFAALEVLGRDVVYIKYPGEGHGIAGKRSKYVETKRMHIEWFDKYLKDQPGAWDKRMETEFKK